jgi:dienelactone hydrolase
LEQSTRAELPWLAETQRPPETIVDAPDLSPLLVDREGRSINTLDGWQVRRKELRRSWCEILRPLPLDRGAPPAFEVLDEEYVGGIVRQHVRYEVEPSVETEAFLLKPAHHTEPVPGIIVLHSTVPHCLYQPAGLAGPPEKHFGLRFAQQGYVTLCPRNFLWPNNRHIDTNRTVAEFQRRHPGCTGMAKMLWDAQRGVDVLAHHSEVDAARLGAVGHSLGAKEVLYLSAFDERIRVSVSSEGGVGTRFSNWDAPWYLGDAIKAPDFAREHHELLALCAPRAFLLVGGNSADGDQSWPFIDAALGVYRLYGESPRLGLYNHKQGHNVPPQAAERIGEWFREYLPV